MVRLEAHWPAISSDSAGINVPGIAQHFRLPAINDSDKPRETIFSDIGHLCNGTLVTSQAAEWEAVRK